MTAHLKELQEYFTRQMGPVRADGALDEEDIQLLWSAIERTVKQAESGAYLVNASAYVIDEYVIEQTGNTGLTLRCHNGIVAQPLMSIVAAVRVAQILEAVRAHEAEYHPVPKEH